MNINFRGKRALVTGAGKGIGREVAIRLAECEAEVVAISRTQLDLDTLSKISPKIYTVCLDIGNWQSIKEAIEKLGPIDLLVNNAGILEQKVYGAISEEDLNRTFDINVKAIINITQIIAEGMKSRGGGAIVNVSSIFSYVASPSYSTYCTSKGAVDQLTRSMAVEFGPHNIRINAVNPTAIRTPMAEKEGMFDPNNNYAKQWLERTPLKRFGGIGRGVAIKLAECGAEVIAVSRTQSDLDELSRISDKIKTICLDIGNWEATKATIQSIDSIDLLVNNAAIVKPLGYGEISETDIDEVYNINVKAIINITQLIANDMKSRGTGGSIVNVSSLAGFKAGPEIGIYASSKGAVDQLTRSMAVEFGPHKIRVNSVNPTAIRTRMAAKYFDERNDLSKVFIARTPLRRFGEVDDVVYPILYLLSDFASMVSGVTLPIDGGLSVCF